MLSKAEKSIAFSHSLLLQTSSGILAPLHYHFFVIVIPSSIYVARAFLECDFLLEFFYEPVFGFADWTHIKRVCIALKANGCLCCIAVKTNGSPLKPFKFTKQDIQQDIYLYLAVSCVNYYFYVGEVGILRPVCFFSIFSSP